MRFAMWAGLGLAAVVGLYLWIELGIRVFYHPMWAKGDGLWPVRPVAALGPSGMFVLALVFRRRMQGRRPLWVFLGVGACFAMVFAPSIDTGYRRTVLMGDARYEIPWAYGPGGGALRPLSGDVASFRVEVSPIDLRAIYETACRERWVLGKALPTSDLAQGFRHAAVCRRGRFQSECQWARDSDVYRLLGRDVPEGAKFEAVRTEVERLLDGFRVP